MELGDGRIGYSLKKRWRDGTTAVVMTKEVLMERLCALVPKPRKHLVTYHGVLAPASGLRSRVVPRRGEEEGEAGGCRHGAGGGGEGENAAAVAVFVLTITNVAYSLLSVLSVAAVAICTPRIEKPWALLGPALVNPFYKEVLRWVRFRATMCELLRIRYEDTFLPMSAWVHAKRY